MKRSFLDSPELWIGLNIAIILSSAVPVLYAPARHMGAFLLPFGGILGPAYFLVLLRRLRAEGTGNLSIGEIHAQAKAGRRLRVNHLETAAAVAMLMASISFAY